MSLPRPNDQSGWWRAFAEITTLGITFPLAIGAGYLLGWWLDGIFGTGPWLAIAGAILGVAAAFIQLFRLASRNEKRGDDRNPPSGS